MSTTTVDPRLDEQQRTIATLRAVADWLEQHPDACSDLSPSGGGWRMLHYVSTREEMLAVAKALGGQWQKNAEQEYVIDGAQYFELHQEIVPGVDYQIYSARNEVCERVVVGTESVEIEEPDPEALAQVPTVKRIEQREIVKWRCAPLHEAKS